MVEYLYNCDGTEDFSAMILCDEKVGNYMDNHHYLNDSPCSFCPKIFIGKAEIIEPMEVKGNKHMGISNMYLLSRDLYEY